MAQAIAAVIYFVYTYWAAIQIVIAVAATAYTLKSQRDQQRAMARAELEAQQRNSYRNFRQPLAARRRVYGLYRVGGPFLFLHNVHTYYDAHLIIALAGHHIKEIINIYIFKKTCNIIEPSTGKTEGKYRKNIAVFAYLGTDEQNVGAVMRSFSFWENGRSYAVPNVISETDRFAGIACLHAFSNDFSVDWDGDQPEFSALIRGHDGIWDPRTNTTGWSQNPALIAAHYLMDAMGFPLSAIDWDTVIASANVCDEFVFIKGGGLIRRYQLNGVITTDSTFETALNDIQRSMGGFIRYSSGKWLIQAGAPISPHATPITEADFLDGYVVELDRPARSLPNSVRGNFIDSGTWVASAYPSWEDSDYVAEDGGVVNYMDADYTLVTDHRQAQRLARIELSRARAKISLSGTMSLRGLIYRVGDVIVYSSPELGLVEELFIIDALTIAAQDGTDAAGASSPILGVRVDLISYDPAMYDWNPEEDEQPLIVGAVNINNIYGAGSTTESDTTTTPSFSTTYTASWVLPPEDVAQGAVAGVKQRFIGHVDISYRNVTTGDILTTTIGWTDLLEQHIQTATHTVTFSFPSGYTYLTHELKDLSVETFAGSNSLKDYKDLMP